MSLTKFQASWQPYCELTFECPRSDDARQTGLQNKQFLN